MKPWFVAPGGKQFWALQARGVALAITRRTVMTEKGSRAADATGGTSCPRSNPGHVSKTNRRDLMPQLNCLFCGRFGAKQVGAYAMCRECANKVFASIIMGSREGPYDDDRV